MTYLELVNKVLIRLRENTVSSVSENSYSMLIGDLVNKSKTFVEMSWNWNGLRKTFFIDTIPDVYTYVLTDSRQGSKLINAWNDTTKRELTPMSTGEAERQFLTNRQPSAPTHYSFNGMFTDQSLKVNLWPIPDRSYFVSFNMFVPQTELVNDGDVLLVPHRPVIEGAAALAVRERGEDGGEGSAFQNNDFVQFLSDAISSDAGLHSDETDWYVP
jgi:hypothetical protein